MFNTGLFNSEDTKLDYILKISTLVNVFCLFVNSFFGYWISLDKAEWDDYRNSWSVFASTAVLFYISVGILSFSTFIAMCRHYSHCLIINGIISFILFFIGLFHPGIRENFFCFILLFMATFQFFILGYYYRTIDQCQLRQHGYDCRGKCIQQEYLNQLKSWDDSMFSGRIQSLFSNTFQNFNNNNDDGNNNDNNNGNQSSMTEIHFHNSIEQPEPPQMPPPKPSRTNLSTIETIKENNWPTTDNNDNPMTMNVDIESQSISNVDNLMSSQTSLTTNRFGHRRQPSQGSQSNQSMTNQLQHLDPSSFLQFS